MIYKGFPGKKVLSLVLCVAVMLSVMVLGAGAAFSDQDKIENTEAVDACSALNIIGGYEDGSFHPERNIKRSEITKMICVALNGGNEPNVSTNAVPTFNDVRGTSAEWAEGYIEACVAQGIVSGVGGGRFSPDGNVTGAQLAKMLLVCLGYNSDNEGFTGNAWETNVNVRASQKSLYVGLEDMDTSAAVTRDQAAQMVWNALNAYEVEYKTTLVTDENGNLVSQVTVQDKQAIGDDNTPVRITLLGDKYEAYVNVGTMQKIDGEDFNLSMSVSDREDSDKENIWQFTNVTTDYSDLLGQKVKVMFTKSNNVLGVYAISDNTTYTLNLKDVAKDGDKVDINGTSYAFDDGTTIAVQTVTEDGTVTDAAWTSADFDKYVAGAGDTKVTPAIVTFVDNDGDGKLNCAYVTYYATAEVTYVGADRIVAGSTYKMADENIASDIEANDYVAISYNRYDSCRDIVKAEVVTDTLNSSKDKTDYQQFEIGGTWYNITNDLANEVSVGDTVKATVVAGVIIDIETDDGAAVPSNIAVLVGTGGNTTVYGDQVKLHFFDGTLKTVTLSTSTKVDLELGRAYKVSGSDTSTTLKNVEENQKYNGFESLIYATEAGTDTEFGTADDVFNSPVTVTINGTANTIDGKTVADDAVIVVYDETGRSKIITGKQFNDLSADMDDIIADNGQAAFVKESSGLSRVRLASIEVSADHTISEVTGTSNDNYAYIIDGGRVVAGDDVQYTIWNGSGDPIVVKEEGVTASDRSVDMVIGYSSIDEDGYIQDVDDDIIDLADVIDPGFSASSNGTDTANAYVGSNSAAEKSYVSVDNTKLSVTADTKVILVDSSKSGDAMAVPYTYGTTTLTKAADTNKMNVAFILAEEVSNGSAELEMLVVDVNGEFDEWYSEEPSTPETPDVGEELTNPTTEELRNALADATLTAFTISGDIESGTYTIPSTKTVTLKGANLNGVNIAGDVTVDSGALILSGTNNIKGTVTMDSSATTITDFGSTTAIDKIEDNATATTAAKVTELLGYSDDVTVQAATVDNTVDVTGKKLTVVGKLTTGTTLPTATADEIDATSVDASAVAAPGADDITALFGYSNDVTVGTVTETSSNVTIGENQKLTAAGLNVTGYKVQIDATGTLELTAQVAAAQLELVEGSEAGATFIHMGSSDTTTNKEVTDSDTAKFYSAPGALSEGSGDGEAATAALDSDKIVAGTYTWNIDAINAGSSDNTNNQTAFEAWLVATGA